MVSSITVEEAAHRKEIDEEALSEAHQIPPAIQEENDLEGQTQSQTSESDVESSKGQISSEWDSTDDAGNPRNWPTWKKVFHTAIPALYGFVV